MKVVFFLTFLLLTAQCVPVHSFNYGILRRCFNWKQIHKFYELLHDCWKSKKMEVLDIMPPFPLMDDDPFMDPAPSEAVFPDVQEES